MCFYQSQITSNKSVIFLVCVFVFMIFLKAGRAIFCDKRDLNMPLSRETSYKMLQFTTICDLRDLNMYVICYHFRGRTPDMMPQSTTV